MNNAKEALPGINIQWPWSQLLVDQQKTVETRSYPLPRSKQNITLAIIETPGARGRQEAGIDKARIIGTITFSGSFRYASKAAWLKDRGRHCVAPTDDQFGYREDKEKWGWVVREVRKLREPVAAPKRRGIVFAKNCSL